ncbi:MAG: hypothetical protein WCP16_26180 [Pseudanabaena sp. ELA645]
MSHDFWAIASTIYLLKAIAIIMSRRYTVQSSVIKLGTLLKSPVFRVSNTKLLEMAIAAILKSIVDTRTFCLLISSNMAIALASNGKTGAFAKLLRVSNSSVYPRAISVFVWARLMKL